MNSHHRPVIFIFTPGPMGGAERVVANGVRALKDQGLQVQLWVIKEKRAPHASEIFLDLLHSLDIRSEIFECKGVWDFELLQRLKKALARTSPKIIHAHGFKASFYSYLSSSESTKLVLTHHGKTSHTLKVRIYEWIEYLIMRRSSAVIAVSGSMKENLIEQKVPDKKIHVVENILTFPTEGIKLISNQHFQLIFIGRLSQEKGCRYLIEGLELIRSKNVNLIILGDGSERASLEKLTKELNLTSRVKFMGFQKDIVPFLKEADALVMPSLREGQPLALIEACSYGLPILGSRVGGIPEMVKHGLNGLLFPPGDSRSMAMMIDQWASKKEHFQVKANGLRSEFKKRFSQDRWARDMKIIYQTVLNH